jgi:hypothetical protein
MARANRTAELLAAARLVDLELGREAEKTRRASAQSQALASLIPELVQAGTSIAGKVNDYNLDKADREAVNLDRMARGDVAKTNAATAASNAKAAETKAEAARVKAEADRVKANAEAAERTRKAEEEAQPQRIAGAASDVESAISMPGGVSQAQLEQIAVARGLPATEWRTVLNARDANVDAINAGALAAQKAAADVKTAERKATAPTGPKPKSPEEVRRQEVKDKIAEATLKQLEGKPDAAAAAADKLTTAQAEDVANIVGARRALARIDAEAKKTDPNILKSAWNSVLSTVGVDSPLTGYVAEVRNFNSAVGAMRSGASIGVAEQKRLDEFLVSPGDTIGAVESKKAAFEQYLNDKEAGLNAVRGIQGQAPIRIPGTAATPQKPMSEMTEEEIDARIEALKGKR